MNQRSKVSVMSHNSLFRWKGHMHLGVLAASKCSCYVQMKRSAWVRFNLFHFRFMEDYVSTEDPEMYIHSVDVLYDYLES